MPSVEERIARLEQALHDAVMVFSSGRPYVLERTLSASGNCQRLYEFMLQLKEEQGLGEANESD